MWGFRVYTYCHHKLVWGILCYCAGLVEVYCHLPESARIVTMICSEASYTFNLVLPFLNIRCPSVHIYSSWTLSRVMVNYQFLVLCITNCHSNCNFRSTYALNECRYYSINFIPILNHQANIYIIHELLHILMVGCQLRIPTCGSRCLSISTIHCVDSFHTRSEHHFLHVWWDTSHCLNRSLYVPTEMLDRCVQNDVVYTLGCIRFKYRPEEISTSPVVHVMLYCSCGK